MLAGQGKGNLKAEKGENSVSSYCNPKQNFIRKYPRALFEHNGIVLKQGMTLKLNTSGGALRGTVAALDDNDVFLDLNPANLY